MRLWLCAALTIGLVWFGSGCRKQPPAEPDDAAGDDAGAVTDDPATTAPPLAKAYSGPPLTAQIQVQQENPPLYLAMVSVTTPTKGYRLQEDRAELQDGLLRLYLMLEKPAPEEDAAPVEQMLMLSHREQAVLSAVEVYVEVVTRGQPPAEPGYRLAATYP